MQLEDVAHFPALYTVRVEVDTVDDPHDSAERFALQLRFHHWDMVARSQVDDQARRPVCSQEFH